MKTEIRKLIENFEKKHKEIYDDEDGNTDCNIIYNEIHRVAQRKDWLGDDISWTRAMKEQKEMDLHIRCYVCEFLQKLKKELKDGN